jgi:predicted nucleotide-binding protein (sugar kinase/HSP70/actin superfamily)
VIEADGSPMPVRKALALINQTLDEALAEQEGEFDGDTRFAVTWFETHGMEVVLPTVVDFFRRDLMRERAGIARDHFENPLGHWVVAGMTDWLYERVLGQVDGRMRAFADREARPTIEDLATFGEEFADRTFVVGEGWLIPAEISAYARKGVASFVVVQPFGCLPNHISGRGMIKALRRKFPDIRIIALDFDADTSFANLENRLQMLIMSQRTEQAPRPGSALSGRCPGSAPPGRSAP